MRDSSIRSHVHEESFDASPEELFSLLTTPSAIRAWWSAARAIVLPETDGIWAAAWGPEEDNPDYVTIARIRVFEPPRALVLDDYRYWARSGPLPFDADFRVDFRISDTPDGARLRVTQRGFPCSAEADDFLAACEAGWRETFAGIRRYVESEPGID